MAPVFSRSTDEVARKSIVRICFDWQPERGEEYKFMVIAGVIISITDAGEAVIVADPTCFMEKDLSGQKLSYTVNFPKAGGYEETIGNIPVGQFVEDFYIFTLKPNENGYITPVMFETKPLNEHECVNTFLFPREGYITPTSYPRGYIISSISHRVTFHDCNLHEYGYLGSPVFNCNGHLVAINYLDKGHMQAWTALHLQKVIMNWNSALILNGKDVTQEPVEMAKPPTEE